MIMPQVIEVSESRERSLANLRIWQPGQSGNPGGRPKTVVDAVAICQKHGEKACQVLEKLLDSKDERIQFAAAKEVLDRGFGKPVQAVTSDNPVATLTFLHLVAAKQWSDANAGRVVDVEPQSQSEAPRDLMAPATE